MPEFELMDTGIFDESRYFDVFVEYAKAAPEDILIRIKCGNRGPEAGDAASVAARCGAAICGPGGRDSRKPQISLKQAAH